MDSGLSTIRNLLYVVLVLVVLAVATTLYLGNQLSRNSDDLKSLGEIMQQQVNSSMTEQSKQLQDKMDRASQQMDTASRQMEKLDQDAAGIDKKMDAAQQKMVDRMKDELPKILDRYIKSRGPMIQHEIMKQVPPQ